MIKILDVTLRDGGYRNNFNFGEADVKHIVANLAEAGIDYIEVGYRNGSFKPIENMGITGNSTNEYLQLLNSLNSKAKLGVVYHPRNIQEQDIKDMFDCGISLLRCCFDPNRLDYTLRLIDKTKELGMISCVNFTRISQLPKEDLLKNAKMAVLAGADVIYLADSNGSLFPHEIGELTSMLKDRIDTEVGFHAHNHLNLATANAIAAINNGATFIDSSLRGMGKGPGNLQTEFWVAYLLKIQKTKSYNFGKVLELAEYVSSNVPCSKSETSLIDIMTGSLDFSVEEKSKLDDICFKEFNNLFFNKHMLT